MTETHTLEEKLNGKLLIAMPGMGDPRFHKAVIYICSHSPDGAMGLVINHPRTNLSFSDLLDQLDITPEQRAGARLDVDVLAGGPVEPGQGFVLHSTDYHKPGATVAVEDGVNLTATMDVLKALAQGEGPRDALFALGYAGWGPGQLESELLANAWLTCPGGAEFIFGHDYAGKYAAALAKIGIDPAMLLSEAGHA
jgi:putative transcriptional regulator